MKRMRQTDELLYNYCPTCKTGLQFRSIENRFVLGCRKCSFLFWNNPKPVVSALINKDNNILLVNRKSTVFNGYWSLPGGIINYLEEPAFALKREVYEETNFEISKLRLIDTYLIIYAPYGLEKYPSHTSIDIVYECQINKPSGNLNRSILNSEVNEVRFFSPNNLPTLIAFKHREIINNFSRQL